MRFEWPLMLLVLLVVPAALVAYLLVERRPARYAVRFTNLDVLAGVVARGPQWRRYVPPALAVLALTAAVTALARPQLERSVDSEQASIALTLDVSGSMRAEDVKPTRLGAAQEAVRRFLDKLPKKYRAGLVTFAEEAFIAAPLTHDRNLVREALQYTYTGRGTAIGDALARSVELLQPVAADGDTPAAPAPTSPNEPNRPLSAILLLSDGAQTRGVLQPLEGAARAESYGIPIYAVALGTPEGVIMRWDGSTRPAPPDPVTLQEIAELTGGEFYETQTVARLNEVYENLASKLGDRREWQEASSILLGGAALLALVAGFASLLWIQRLP